jgi:hypothetical protein
MRHGEVWHMILFLLILLFGGYAIAFHAVPIWAYLLVLLVTGWRAIEQLREREAQRREQAQEAAATKREDEISARCERNGGHERALPPYPERSCAGCECSCHEAFLRGVDFITRKMGG